MRLTSLLTAAAFVAASGVAMAGSMSTPSPKPNAMHGSSMKSHHMMMASPKPKVTPVAKSTAKP